MIYRKNTNLIAQTNKIFQFIENFINYKFNSFSIQLLSILLGFFVATALSTIPAQTGDWSIVASAIIVTNQEVISKITYQNYIPKYRYKTIMLKTCLKYCNSIKIGILYGLFVDAFKLGS